MWLQLVPLASAETVPKRSGPCSLTCKVLSLTALQRMCECSYSEWPYCTASLWMQLHLQLGSIPTVLADRHSS